MKIKTVFTSIVFIAGTLLLLASCNKDSSGGGTPPTPIASDLNGTWETTNYNAPNDTLRIVIALTTTTSNGVFSYRNNQAITAGFFVGDPLFENITQTGATTYKAKIYYRYGPANAQLGYTTGVLALQNGGTILFADASTDPLTGNVVPDHYFKKK